MSLARYDRRHLMLGAYGWALVKPVRRTLLQHDDHRGLVIVAVIVGGLETLNLIGDEARTNRRRGFWGAIAGALNDNFGLLGYVIIGVFLVAGSVRSYSIKPCVTTIWKFKSGKL